MVAEGSYPASEIRSSGCTLLEQPEERPHVQGKEQQLRFAGAAMKIYPMFNVRETQVRWSVPREGIRGQTEGNHNHRQLAIIQWK